LSEGGYVPPSVWGFEGGGSQNQRKIVIFGNFEISPRCHGNMKFKPEHVDTKAMIQLTFVPSLISIEAVFIVL
jgi:hypothetical protein